MTIAPTAADAFRAHLRGETSHFSLMQTFAGLIDGLRADVARTNRAEAPTSNESLDGDAGERSGAGMTIDEGFIEANRDRLRAFIRQVMADDDAEGRASVRDDAGICPETARQPRSAVGMLHNALRAVIGPHGQNIPSREAAAMAPAIHGDELHPSPEDQRAGFEAVLAQGRPTTIEIKHQLDLLRDRGFVLHAQLFGPNEGSKWAHSLASLIDRLGCALIDQDTKLHQAEEAARLQVEQRQREEEEHEWTRGEVGRLSAANIELNEKLSWYHPPEGEQFDITKPRDTRQDALLAMNVLDRYADSDGPFTTADAGRMIGTIRKLLADRDDMEMHRDAARDAIADVRVQRDDARRDAESDRANLAASVEPWLWVQGLAAEAWVPASLRRTYWGQPTGLMAQAIVAYLRDRVAELESTVEPATYSDAQREAAATIVERHVQDTLPDRDQAFDIVDLAAEALGMRRAQA